MRKELQSQMCKVSISTTAMPETAQVRDGNLAGASALEDGLLALQSWGWGLWQKTEGKPPERKGKQMQLKTWSWENQI